MSAQIYLASASPRRRELLTQIGVSYELISVEVDETPHLDEEPYLYAGRLALAKARAGWNQLDQALRHPVLGADTVVVLRGQILGKPTDAEHAKQMLRALSGQEHLVLSAVALVQNDREAVRIQTSRVRFRPLSEAEINAYCQTGEPLDKAGAYAIQGLAAIFVEHLQGSYSGVMGLPLFETAELLAAFSIAPLSC